MRVSLIILGIFISGIVHADSEKLQIMDAATGGYLDSGLLRRAMFSGLDDISLSKSTEAAAVNALKSGAADIIFLSSIESVPKELEAGKWFVNACVIIVNKDNPVNNISSKALAGIFSGKITRWKSVNGSNFFLQMCAVKNGSGKIYYNIFKKMIMKGLTFDKKIYWAASSDEIAAVAAGNRSIIAFGAFKDPWPENIKYLMVDNIAPTKQNILNAKYPLVKRVFVAHKKNPGSKTRKFIDFITSEHFQSFLTAKDCLPYPERK